MLVTVIFMVICHIRKVRCFNFDIDIPVIKLGNPGTYFGYAVALHFNGTDKPLLLVGSPRDESGQVGTKHAGAFYSCPLNGVQVRSKADPHSRNSLKQWCRHELIEYKHAEDMYNNTHALSDNNVYSKDFQMLGATVSSTAHSDSQVLVCAPTYLFHSRAYVTGMCYVLDHQLRFKSQHQNCRQFERSGFHNDYGVCEMGFSGVMFEYGKSKLGYDSSKYGFVTGMPGSLNWKGGIVANTYEPFTTYAQTTLIREQVGTSSFLGYSVGVGSFGFSHEGKDFVTVAAGAPRSSVKTSTGGVFFSRLPVGFRDDNTGLPFLKRLRGGLFNLTGDEFLGSSFGYSLAVVDIDKDGFDDLVVGAPNYYNGTRTESHGGAVFVYFSSGKVQSASENVFHEPLRITGPNRNCQFGTSVTTLGDINKDDFQDFAVGAPYDKKGGSVSIFLGSKREEFDEKPSQIIYGEDISSFKQDSPLETFGWSLSGGSDVDSNSYPDLAVGAFKSDAVVLLRTRPIVNIEADVIKEDLERQIDKDDQSCDGGVLACFTVRTVVRLSRRNTKAPVNFDQDRFDCKLEVLRYAQIALPRAEFKYPRNDRNPHVHSWKCGRGIDRRQNERMHELIIRESTDWLNPLSFRFSVHLPGDNSPKARGFQLEPGQPLVDISRFPVLDKKLSSREFEIQFNKKCGDNNNCESDLRLLCGFHKLDRLTNGTYEKQVGHDAFLDLQFNVTNHGEHAYESKLFVEFDENELEIPEILQGSYVVNEDNVKDRGLFVVDLGNPFGQSAEASFVLRFELHRGSKTGLSRPLLFKAYMNTSSSEQNEADNLCEAQVRVIKAVNVGITGESRPKSLLYGGTIRGESEMEFEEDIGPLVYHNYVVDNSGDWGVSNVTVFIQWPYEVQSIFRHGKWALYLMEAPVMSTLVPGQADRQVKLCSIDYPADYINPLNLLENTRFSLQPLAHNPSRVKRANEEGSRSGRSTLTRELRVEPTVRNEFGEDVLVVEIDCLKQTAKCFTIVCHFAFIPRGIKPQITIRARLWNSTLVEDYRDVARVEISSYATLEIDKRQGIQQTDESDDHASAKTTAQPDLPKIPEKLRVPVWIIVVAVVSGIFLLFLIIICCWWCGFFKRKQRAHGEPLYKAEVTHQEDLLQEYET